MNGFIADNAEASQTPITGDAYHAQSVEDVLAHFSASPSGLGTSEADHRMRLHGRNELPATRRRHPLIRFLVFVVALGFRLGGFGNGLEVV